MGYKVLQQTMLINKKKFTKRFEGSPAMRKPSLNAKFVILLGAFLAFASFGCRKPSGAASGHTSGASPKYAKTANALEAFIERQMKEQNLPAFSIALVDDQKIVWARGFGYADANRKVPATAQTVYRVGSVSKPFTDIAIMQLVEKGKLDLDAPITQYLPDFHPKNPFGAPITLRELMAHRAGLVREPPAGNYFDSSTPSLAATVKSLNLTNLVYPPGTHTKYSNAGVAVVGYVLQCETGQAYEQYMKQHVLEPMGLDESSFAMSSQIQSRVATGVMWTYDGLTIPTPTFSLDEGPAGSLYSTVSDLGRFLEVLFAGGRGPNGPILQQQTLEEMWKPQFAPAGAKAGYGLGFGVSQLDGHRMVGHAGGIYGFATQASALPDEKLGVVTVTTVDGANAVTARVADLALRMMLAVRSGKAPPETPETAPVTPTMALTLSGRYSNSSSAFDLIDGGTTSFTSGGQTASDFTHEDGPLFLLPVDGGWLVRLRLVGSNLIGDGRLGYGPELTPVAEGVRVGDASFARAEMPKPKPSPRSWDGLIGEYGWDYDRLYILERDGKLTALIEWFEYDPLREISNNVFAFPGHGLYDAEQAVFTPGADGVATAVRIGGVVFPRRKLGGTTGPFFHIQPLKPIAELRREALAAQPPKETGNFRKPDLVDVTSFDPKIKLDIRYATTRDFIRTPVYTEAKAFLQRPAAEALARVAHKLEARGYGLLIHDAYRPWYVTKIFWDATPVDKRIFVADPSDDSRHNRGCSVDLTLYDLATERQVPMTGHYDEMTERSYARYPGGTSLEHWYRNLLRRTMESEGFTVYQFEWWHFDYKSWQHYPILNLKFEQLSAKRSASAGAAKVAPARATPLVSHSWR